MAVKKALLLSSASEIISRLINLTSVVLFARLLSPSELGIFILASSFMVMVSEVRMLGTSSYLIRENTLTKDKVASALGLSILISWGLGFFVMAGAPFLAAFYENQELQFLIWILSVSFFTAPFVSISNAILSREFKFGRLMILQTAGPLVGLLVSILCIYEGFSYYSLAFGQCAGLGVDAVLSWLLRSKAMCWIPAFSNLRSIARVGIYTSLINMFSRFETTMPDLILGKVTSTAFVAYFSRALGLHLFIKDFLFNGISKVAMPYISAQNRAGKCMKETYLMASELTICFILPPTIAATIAAELLIGILFGEQWERSIVLAKALGFWMGVKCLTYYAKPLLLIKHNEKELFFIRLAVLTFLILSVIAVINIEPSYIAHAFIVAGVFDFLLISSLLKKTINLGFGEFFQRMIKTGGVTLICTLIAFLTFNFVSECNIYIAILLYGGILTFVWVSTIFLIRHPLKNYIILTVNGNKAA